MTEFEINESTHHFRKVWQLYAQISPGGEAFDQDGLSFANANQPWFFMNVGLLNRPIGGESDLDRRATEALKYFEASRNPWLLTGSEDWFGGNAPTVLSNVGLEFKLDLAGMVAERLSPRTRALPDVQLRCINSEETRIVLADLNADAYGVPRDWGRRALGSAALWGGPLFGTVAYVKGVPASGAFAILIDKALYVAWVATSKGHRGLGLAELVIRTSLEAARKATGIERTVLHATKYGYPVYQRIGYRSVVKFPMYGPKQAMVAQHVER
jgi:GNAT superfamily N-acetyltransferase